MSANGRLHDCGECRGAGLQGARRCPEAPEEKGLPPTMIDGDEYPRCPVAAVDRRAAHEAFLMYRHYKAGFLPGPGGAMDQLEIELETIEVVAAVAAQIEAERASDGRQ